MTRLASNDDLRPARALLTPTWIGALAVLVANDHWLKGSGLLPDLLTGKLSDFAGMLMAPTLLAAVLVAAGATRLVGARRLLLACHVAVGVVFAGIQLSLAFADQWSTLMAALGHPWVITSDPWDLVALPFLVLSWHLLVPEMDATRPALVPLQRTAVACLSVFGLWSTVATSQVEPGWEGEEWYEDVQGHTFINNANDFDLSLHVRPLRTDLALDCEQISADPGRLLSEDAFGEAVHWLLPARTNVGLELQDFGGCGAAWVAGEGIPPRIVFTNELDWRSPQWWPGQTFDPADLPATALGVEFGDQGAEWVAGDPLLFVPRDDAPEQPEQCELDSEELRIDWSLEVPDRPVRVDSIAAGIDGCFALELQALYMTQEGLAEVGESKELYLCAAAAAVPFAEGELLRFEEFWGSEGERELRVTLVDELLEDRITDSGSFVRRVRYLRGGSDLPLIGPALETSLVAIDAVSCPWMGSDELGCATVERRVDLTISGGQSYLEPGVPMMVPGSTMLRTAVLGYARQHAVVDQACAAGSLDLRYDIDLAVIEEPKI